MVTMEQSMVPKVMETIQSFNFSRVGEAVEVMMNKMTEPMNVMSQLNTTSSMANNLQNLMRYCQFVCGVNKFLVKFSMDQGLIEWENGVGIYFV
jgi:hypothetical protein